MIPGLAVGDYKQHPKLGGCVRVFLQLFDWNCRLSGKKRFFRTQKQLPGERPIQRRPFVSDYIGGATPLLSFDTEQVLVTTSSREEEDNLEPKVLHCSNMEETCKGIGNMQDHQMSNKDEEAVKCIALMQEDKVSESASIKVSSKDPGVIGRLMGLESLPIASASAATTAQSNWVRQKEPNFAIKGEKQQSKASMALAELEKGLLSDEELEALLDELNGNMCTILSHLPAHLGISSYISRRKWETLTVADSNAIPVAAFMKSRNHVSSDEQSRAPMANLGRPKRTKAAPAIVLVQEAGRKKIGRSFSRLQQQASGEVPKRPENQRLQCSIGSAGSPGARLLSGTRDGRSDADVSTSTFKKISASVTETRKQRNSKAGAAKSRRKHITGEVMRNSQELTYVIAGEGKSTVIKPAMTRKNADFQQHVKQLQEETVSGGQLLENRQMELSKQRAAGDEEACDTDSQEASISGSQCMVNDEANISMASVCKSVPKKDLSYGSGDRNFCSCREAENASGSRVPLRLSEEEMNSLRRRSAEVAKDIKGKELNPLLGLLISRRAEREAATATESQDYADFERVGDHEPQQLGKMSEVPDNSIAKTRSSDMVNINHERDDQISCMISTEMMRPRMDDSDEELTSNIVNNVQEGRQKLSEGRSEAGAAADGGHFQQVIRWRWRNHDEVQMQLQDLSNDHRESAGPCNNAVKIMSPISSKNTTAAMLQDVICALHDHHSTDRTSTPTSCSSDRHRHSCCHPALASSDKDDVATPNGHEETETRWDSRRQPSPVSVLLAPFDDDADISPERSRQLSFSTIQSEADYVAAILAAATPQAGTPLPPGNGLFVQLEERIDDASWLDSEVAPPTYAYRKLVFDCVFEALTQAEDCVGDRRERARVLYFQEVCRWRHCSWEFVTLDEVVEADLRKPCNAWVVFKAQARHLLLLLQRSILELLVEELVCDLVLTSHM
ncbi:hypothetical protein GOP47_0001864 [Adiantum capillus-veneris]|uniref:Uncharacterized protein n=1 Tax=Adiantum capillus-veneris TaxID=13818 RepID=A0A9D4ZQF9_ADICA|nr:hypothetical protein GOP47_0001864 [Adiantum capillus-veneris]